MLMRPVLSRPSSPSHLWGLYYKCREVNQSLPLLQSLFLSLLTGPLSAKIHSLWVTPRRFFFLLCSAFSYLFIFWPCHVACRILVPQPGTSAVKAWSPNYWTARKFPLPSYLKTSFSMSNFHRSLPKNDYVLMNHTCGCVINELLWYLCHLSVLGGTTIKYFFYCGKIHIILKLNILTIIRCTTMALVHTHHPYLVPEYFYHPTPNINTQKPTH